MERGEGGPSSARAGGSWRERRARRDDGDELAGVVGLHARRAGGPARALERDQPTGSSSGWTPATPRAAAAARRRRRVLGARRRAGRSGSRPRRTGRSSTRSCEISGLGDAFAVHLSSEEVGPRKAGARTSTSRRPPRSAPSPRACVAIEDSGNGLRAAARGRHAGDRRPEPPLPARRPTPSRSPPLRLPAWPR